MLKTLVCCRVTVQTIDSEVDHNKDTTLFELQNRLRFYGAETRMARQQNPMNDLTCLQTLTTTIYPLTSLIMLFQSVVMEKRSNK